jgi:MFS family permease
VRRLIDNGAFRRLWLGQCLSFLADWTFRTALLIWIYSLTHSGAALSVMGLCETLPLLILAPIAGVYVDRWDRRRTMAGALVARAAFLAPLFWVHDSGQVAVIYVVTILLSAASQFFGPAAMAVLPNLVGEAELGAANSLLQLIQTLVGIVGPAAGAAVLGMLGVPVTLTALMALYALAALVLLGVRLPSDGGLQGDGAHEPFLASMRAGLRVLTASRQMMALVAVVLVALLGAGGLSVLDVVFVTRALHQAPSTMGILLSANGAGAAVGGIAVAVASSRRALPYTRLLSWGIVGLGLGTLAYAASPTMLLAAASLVGVGLCFPAIMVGFMTLVQRSVEDAYLGRVMSLFNTAIAVVTIISVSVAGVLTDYLDVRSVIAAGGAALLAAGLLALAILTPSPGMSVEHGPPREALEPQAAAVGAEAADGSPRHGPGDSGWPGDSRGHLPPAESIRDPVDGVAHRRQGTRRDD